ncbi:MAG TPA: response regulator [bacterium]|nr:response regulator [bacterium]
MEQKTRKKILIIEDNQPFIRILKTTLNAQGYEIACAENGMEGVKMTHKLMPDLVILDLMLPVLDGHKVCRLLKYDQRVSHIPVVILTSRDLEEDADLAKKNGADAFVVKTTHKNVLLDVIDRLISRSMKSKSDQK